MKSEKIISTISTSIRAIFFASMFVAIAPAHAATEPNIERLAVCQESWLDWKDDQARAAKFAESLRANYTQKQDEDYLVPKTAKTLFGMPVAGVYPDTIGMAVGFSVVVKAGFEATKKTIEKTLGKSLHCEDHSDEMQGCQLELGPKKTVLLMAGDKPGTKSTLIGCFYYYEK